jgi:hypothetical protein
MTLGQLTMSLSHKSIPVMSRFVRNRCRVRCQVLSGDLVTAMSASRAGFGDLAAGVVAEDDWCAVIPDRRPQRGRLRPD